MSGPYPKGVAFAAVAVMNPAAITAATPDTVAPSAPADLRHTALEPTGATLAWAPATDAPVPKPSSMVISPRWLMVE